jgi:phenylalanyl-tRNA synthetase beta chain
MKISYNWLSTYLNFNIPLRDCLTVLTEIGLEVDGFTKIGQDPAKLEGLVVGEVLSCEQHPNADKLKLTVVTTDGENRLSIVCGAPNVTAGQKVIVAPVGSTLYPLKGEPFQIKEAKIRGELSQGMLCAEDEIGIGESHDGIIVLDSSTKLGSSASSIFKLELDYEIEIGLTPNRTDAISHYGVARDLAAYYRKKAVFPNTDLPETIENNENLVEVNILDHSGCSRFSGVSISGVKIGPSPKWLQDRLKAIGHNSINNVVDVTNFVMFEMGQPLHAYDLRQIIGNQINVRFAKKDEKITLLNKQEYELSPSNLLICDAQKAMGVAGVMGGMNDSIQADTTQVFLESACFNASVIRKSSKLLGIKSDASYRFERGTDPDIPLVALKRAASLILEIAGGELSSTWVDVITQQVDKKEMHLLYANFDKIIGKKIKRETIKEILTCLDFKIIDDYSDALTVIAPNYRIDVTREIDVIEEVLRIYGINKIDNGEEIRYNRAYPLRQHKNDWQQTLSDQLVAVGYTEIMNLSFIGDKQLDHYPALKGNEIRVLNPVNDEVPVLRPSLLFNGLQSIQYNLNRKTSDLHLFEFGKVYYKQNKSRVEQEMMALWVTGAQHDESWYSKPKKSDFYHAHAALRTILQRTSHLSVCKVKENTNELFNYGLCYTLNGKVLAQIGSVTQKILKSYDIRQEVYYAEIDWSLLSRSISEKTLQVTELSRYPGVRRDLALVIDKSVRYKQLEDLAQETVGALLKEVNLFDVYEGDKLGSNKRSYAISFFFQDSTKTMNEAEIEAVMKKLMTKFETTLAATVRQ